QMTYNLTDLFWIGHVGSGAVAAVGTAGFFIWFSNALTFSTAIGSQVTVSQSLGLKDTEKAKQYSANAFKFSVIFSTFIAIIIYFAAPLLMKFFDLGIDETGFNVTEASIDYLRIISYGLPFFLTNFTYTGIFNGYGNPKVQFFINSSGLFLNMIFDPLLIHGIGFFPKLGVKGAALSTSFSQIVVFIIFSYFVSKRIRLFSLKQIFEKFDKLKIRAILKIGIPEAFRNSMFSVFAMILAKILAQWGPIPIAVQKIGSQIEALSWRTSSSVASALSTVVGQNFGANKYKRIKLGYLNALIIISGIGLLTSYLFIFQGMWISKLFFSRPEVIQASVIYLRILGYSQLFMCIEIVTGGAFNGLGRTIPPAIVSIVFTGSRIPFAIILASIDSLNEIGVWWSISGTSIIKGIVIIIWFYFYITKLKEKDTVV
ncbi:MAG: MATE family efflux transporter, partial [Candidatus Mcinerneyibacterium aminivorans]